MQELPQEQPNDLRNFKVVYLIFHLLNDSGTLEFELVTRKFELVTRCFELVTHGF